MSFMEIYDVLDYLLVFEVEMHLLEVELFYLVYGFFIEEASLEDFVVEGYHVFVTEKVEEFEDSSFA